MDKKLIHYLERQKKCQARKTELSQNKRLDLRDSSGFQVSQEKGGHQLLRDVRKKQISIRKKSIGGRASKRRRNSGDTLTSATDVLQSLLDGKKFALSHAYQVWKLRRHWKDIVGETINQHSKPLFYMRGTLYIWSENSVWTQEFTFLSEAIKQKINDYVGKTWVRNLRFQLQEEIY